MADFEKAFKILKNLEFKNCKNALHKNKGENGYTFMGIYQKAHPNALIWKELERYKIILGETEPLKELSRLLCHNVHALKDVRDIYKREYWDKARLDDVKSQKIAEEIFVFGVNAGIENAIKAAQRLVGVIDDGIVGPKTLKALNSHNGKLFDILFDAEEAKYYESLISAKKRFAVFEDGWLNRAKAV